jgi:2-dehydropantoate 2-reductase
MMREVVAAPNALNLGVSEDKIRYNVERTQSMGSYWASTLLDFVHRKPIELDSIFKYPLDAGTRAGVEMPRLKNMLRVMTQLATLCK